jgi:hypothetical protein
MKNFHWKNTVFFETLFLTFVLIVFILSLTIRLVGKVESIPTSTSW